MAIKDIWQQIVHTLYGGFMDWTLGINKPKDTAIPKKVDVVPEPWEEPIPMIKVHGMQVEYVDQYSIKLSNGMVIYAKDNKLYLA